ncbi:MAG: nitroreductase family protein [Coriobacteriales bacterium]|jgi:nitroreductase|nr:nitroreductase family protein [Coriobacteriales bacterium]
MDSFATLAKERYSVRQFATKPVSQEHLDTLLNAVLIAPTAHNNQPQRVKAIAAPDDLARIDECTPCRFGAPLVLLVCSDTSAAWRRPFDDADSSVVDASIVTTFLMLQAADLGLGSVWVMYFDAAKASSLFGLPKHIVPIALLPIGHPAPDAHPAPAHFESLKLERLLL